MFFMYVYVYIDFVTIGFVYQNLIVTANQKSATDTLTVIKPQKKRTKEEGKKKRKQKQKKKKKGDKNISIIVLNVNELNAPTKRHILAEYTIYMLSTRDPLQI